MMLDHLGEGPAARAIESAVSAVLAEGAVRTPDLGGASTTEEVAAAVLAHVDSPR
jgi:tartrate dehydrogenase/decarboxylase/D-malate dehydrogenase